MRRKKEETEERTKRTVQSKLEWISNSGNNKRKKENNRITSRRKNRSIPKRQIDLDVKPPKQNIKDVCNWVFF